MTARLAHRHAAALVGLTALPVLAVTLYPTSPRATTSALCIICGERGLADALANIVLFAPLGAAIGLAARSRHAPLVAGGALSLVIEIAQYFIPGRDASIGDLLFNTMGAVLGGLLAQTRPWWSTPTARRADALALAGAATAGLVFVLPAVLLAPVYPASTYSGLWTPRLRHLEPYDGAVRSARLAELSLPYDELEATARARDLLARGVPVEVEATAGLPTVALGALFAIYDDQRREILLLGPDRDDLVLRVYARATAWRLDKPDLRLSGAFRGIAPGERFEVAVRKEAGAFCLRFDDREECALGFRASSGWALLLYPEPLSGPLKAMLGAMWMGFWVLPLGLWARRPLVALGAGTIVALALTLGVTSGNLKPPTAGDAAGVVLAVGAGAALRRAVRPPR